jgi:hypothetical protein
MVFVSLLGIQLRLRLPRRYQEQTLNLSINLWRGYNKTYHMRGKFIIIFQKTQPIILKTNESKLFLILKGNFAILISKLLLLF